MPRTEKKKKKRNLSRDFEKWVAVFFTSSLHPARYWKTYRKEVQNAFVQNIS